jgi:hypothetical protein
MASLEEGRDFFQRYLDTLDGRVTRSAKQVYRGVSNNKIFGGIGLIETPRSDFNVDLTLLGIHVEPALDPQTQAVLHDTTADVNELNKYTRGVPKVLFDINRLDVDASLIDVVTAYVDSLPPKSKILCVVDLKRIPLLNQP